MDGYGITAPASRSTRFAGKASIGVSMLLAAGLAVPGPAGAKTKKSAASHERELEEENARLKRQIAELEAKVRSSANPPAAASTDGAGAATPFALKEIEKPAASRQRVATEMTCGAAKKSMGEMTCGATMKPDSQQGNGMKMEPGSNFLMNPVWGGVDMFWNMPKDTWMMNVKWMHNQQNGLQKGTTPQKMKPVAGSAYNDYMMPPTGQSMDMFMFMPMWGVTEDLTLMAMLNYGYMTMPMQMNMSTPFQPNAPMNTGGLMDTNLNVIYRLLDNVVGTLQLNIPTGSTYQDYDPAGMGIGECLRMMLGKDCFNNRAPYGMQLGAGVPALMPALTYNWITDDTLWNLGGQVSGTAYLGTDHGWSPGNSIKLSIWGQRAFDDFTVWLRSNYVNQAQIAGCNPLITGNCADPNGPGGAGFVMPQFVPSNYGGEVANLLLGASYQYRMFSVGVEGGIPYYQNFNGVQLQNSYWVNSGVSFMF